MSFSKPTMWQTREVLSNDNLAECQHWRVMCDYNGPVGGKYYCGKEESSYNGGQFSRNGQSNHGAEYTKGAES